MVRSPPAGTTQAPVPMSRSSVETVMWVPRLGRMHGISSSLRSSSGRIRSAHTPVALTTIAARTSKRSPVSVSVQATPPPSRFVQDLHHLGAVGEHRAEPLGLAEDRQHEADVVGLAVVEEVGRAGVKRGERGNQPQWPPRR